MSSEPNQVNRDEEMIAAGIEMVAPHQPPQKKIVQPRLRAQNQNKDRPMTTDRDDDESATLLPLELTHVPGIVEEQTNYTEIITRYPNRRTAFVGALAMLSFASGRRYRTADNCRTNEYLVCYAHSGAGKDAPRKVNRDIAIAAGCAANVGDVVGSGEGLQDVLLTRAKFLLQNDEFDTLIRAIAEDKSGSKESLVREILTDYSASSSTITKRALSASIQRGGGTKDYCIHPHFTLFGSAVGQYLFETLNERALQNGLVARCLFVDCGRRQERQAAKWAEVPQSLAQKYRQVLHSELEGGRWTIADKPDVKNELTEVVVDADALAVNDETLDRYDSAYRALDGGNNAAEQSFLARSGEHMTKLAMLYAISANPLAPVITADAIQWADKFVTHCQQSMLANIKRFTAANPHEANVKRVMRMLERRPWITKRDITRCLRLPVAVANEVIEYMLATGDLIEEASDGFVIYGSASVVRAKTV